MSIVNGDFEDGETGWTLNFNASVSDSYGAYSGSFAAVMEANYNVVPWVGAQFLQTFAGVVGSKLIGQVVHHWRQGPYDTGVNVFWKSSLKFSINSQSMVTGVWIPWEFDFDDDSPGELEIVLVLPFDPGGIKFGSVQERFLVDALVIPSLETSMIAESLMKWVDAEGFGTEGSDLFCSHLPDKPDNAVVVYDESSPSLSESQALAYDRFGIEVRVRNNDYGVARDNIMDIHRALAAFSGLLAPSTPEVTMVDLVTSPTFLERDSNKRSVWVAHYALWVLSTGDQYRS